MGFVMGFAMAFERVSNLMMRSDESAVRALVAQRAASQMEKDSLQVMLLDLE